MTTEIYIQDDLPDFHKACAEAREEGLDAVQHLSKEYIRYTKMCQKCSDPKTVTLICKQRQRMLEALGRTR